MIVTRSTEPIKNNIIIIEVTLDEAIKIYTDLYYTESSPCGGISKESLQFLELLKNIGIKQE